METEQPASEARKTAEGRDLENVDRHGQRCRKTEGGPGHRSLRRRLLVALKQKQERVQGPKRKKKPTGKGYGGLKDKSMKPANTERLL